MVTHHVCNKINSYQELLQTILHPQPKLVQQSIQTIHRPLVQVLVLNQRDLQSMEQVLLVLTQTILLQWKVREPVLHQRDHPQPEQQEPVHQRDHLHRQVREQELIQKAHLLPVQPQRGQHLQIMRWMEQPQQEREFRRS
jgi:hypothetical protein